MVAMTRANCPVLFGFNPNKPVMLFLLLYIAGNVKHITNCVPVEFSQEGPTRHQVFRRANINAFMNWAFVELDLCYDLQSAIGSSKIDIY